MAPQMSNEQLCVLAREGNRAAQDELIQKNTGFITEIAGEIFTEYGLADANFGIEFDELLQEGRIGLWRCIEKYDPTLGASFLTYAKPSIRNAMIDLVRQHFGQFEIEAMNDYRLPLKRVYLDDVIWGEDRFLLAELIADPYEKTPEQIVIEAETMQDIYEALNALEKRERVFLLYRFGFEDDIEHPLTETARHFLLSENRAKATETSAIQNVRRAFFKFSGSGGIEKSEVSVNVSTTFHKTDTRRAGVTFCSACVSFFLM